MHKEKPMIHREMPQSVRRLIDQLLYEQYNSASIKSKKCTECGTVDNY